MSRAQRTSKSYEAIERRAHNTEEGKDRSEK